MTVLVQSSDEEDEIEEFKLESHEDYVKKRTEQLNCVT